MRKRLTDIFIPSSILVVTALLSCAIAMWTTLRSSNDSIARYVSVWEEEVARNLLLKGDHELFEKIRAQIKDLASEVVSTRPKSASIEAECFAKQDVNVTLYGTPAGELRICRSPEKLFFRSLGSPVFSFGLLMGVLFALWLTRRRSREESTRAVNDLAIRVAHDIRAPLMALKIAAAVAARPSDVGDVGETSADDNRALIESAIKRISGIADELLSLSRTKVKKPELKVIAPLAKSIDVAIQDLIREKQQTAPIPIRFDVAPVRIASGHTSAISTGDFERVVSNLLQNSIEATIEKSRATNGEVKPRITVETLESDTQISITIRDNGVGIPKDVLPRVGDVGFSHGKSGGNGVGFSSARRWATGCGGNLEIRSLEGTGTEVRLTLPRPQTQADLQ